MYDFHDCLSHPYAHVAIGEFKPGRFAEAQQLYQKAVSTYATGFIGAYLLREPDSDKGISVIFWESRETMDANKGDVYQSILKQMSPLFAATPITGSYEVASSLQADPAKHSAKHPVGVA